MLMPRKVKHRQTKRGRRRGPSKGGTEVVFGEYGIQALEPGWITARQIEAARIPMTRHIKRGGKVWINISPDKPVTEKPAETRMGSGKGNPERWVAVVRPGRVLFELSYPNREVAKGAQIGKAGDGEASGDPHGIRQGQPGALGRRRAARTGALRAVVPEPRGCEGRADRKSR